MNAVIGTLAQKVSPTVSPTLKESGSMDKQDFLKLLVTQIEKQDPLNPQDPSEFTAQLTQYSSLEQLININSSLSGFEMLNRTNERMIAASMIGKQASIAGDQMTLLDGGATPVHFTLPRSSDQTALKVYDTNGKLVSTLDLGARQPGAHDYTWNGLDANGNPLDDGHYQFEIEALDSAGIPMAVTSSFTGTVTGARFENGKTLLEIGGGRYTLDEVSGLTS